MVEGEVVAAAFEEGDQVQKDQVLYEIDSSSMTTELTSAENTLTRSRNSYEDALEDYNQALSDYSGTSRGNLGCFAGKEGDPYLHHIITVQIRRF